MPLGLKAIIPRDLKTLSPDPQKITKDVPIALRQFALAVAARLAKYPAQAPPPLGRKRYRRTGDYGRGWTAPGAIRVTGNTVTLVNRVNHRGKSYGVYVGGPVPGRGPGERQAELMGRRGWANISEVAKEEAKLHKPILNRAIQGRATL